MPHRESSRQPSLSLFDVFIGSGRTIRRPTGPPGTNWENSHAYHRKSSAPPSTKSNAPSPDKHDGPTNGDSGSKHSKPKERSKAGNSDKSKKETANGTTEDKDKPNGEKASAKNQNETDFTAEDDAKLIQMKQDGKTWNEIATELGRSKGHIQRRYNKYLKPTLQQGEESNKVPQTNKKDKSETKQQKEKTEKAASESKSKKYSSLAQPPSQKALGVVKQRSHHSYTHVMAPPSEPASESRFSIKSTLALDEDDIFSYGELAAISDLLDHDLDNTWKRVSAAFFNLSGRRILAEDIRDKFQVLEPGY